MKGSSSDGSFTSTGAGAIRTKMVQITRPRKQRTFWLSVIATHARVVCAGMKIHTHDGLTRNSIKLHFLNNIFYAPLSNRPNLDAPIKIRYRTTSFCPLEGALQHTPSQRLYINIQFSWLFWSCASYYCTLLQQTCRRQNILLLLIFSVAIISHAFPTSIWLPKTNENETRNHTPIFFIYSTDTNEERDDINIRRTIVGVA